MSEKSTHKTYTVEEASQRLMQFCAYRDRSHKEVEQKLIEMRMIPEAREQIIIQLMQEGFLNEERFARRCVGGKLGMKKGGRIKMRRHLELREISEPIIRLALSEIEEDQYLKTLEELLDKKQRLLTESDPFKRKRKLTDFLLRKGYESHLVFDLVSSLED